jgi:cell division protease FtsH
VARLLREAEDRARKILSEHREELDKLVELLLEHETVEGEAVYDLVGRPMPGGQPQVLTASAYASLSAVDPSDASTIAGRAS